MNVDEFLSLVRTGSRHVGGSDRRETRPEDVVAGSVSRKRTRDGENPVKSGIMKRPNLESAPRRQDVVTKPNNTSSASMNDELEISEEERLRILRMVEEEPEGVPFDDASLKRMVSVLEKKISKNQEMRIKFPDQPEKFMESEIELNESIQELHALATDSELYGLAVDLALPTTLLGLLPHENSDISCAVVDLLQEITDVDNINENEDATASFLDTLIDEQAISLLTQNLDRLDESNSDEVDGVHNTMAIFENLFELRPQLCASAGDHGLLQWLLKRLKARIAFDPNKQYAGEMLAILLQETQENRAKLGELDGIDILLQQLAVYKRHDPSTHDEAEYMGNLFNCLCSALLWGLNRDRFLKGEGPQLMNLMLREKKQSRNGSLKALNHVVSGPEGASNANKFVDILGLRTLFPLFMKTPNKAKRKGLSAREHEEHVVSIMAGLLQHLTGPNRMRVITKFEENNFEKAERICELHFKYLEKVSAVDQSIKDEMALRDEVDPDEIYLRRLDGGLFTLQLVDYIILEVSVANAAVKEKIRGVIHLRRGSMETIREIVAEFAQNIGDESEDWKTKQIRNISTLLAEF